MKKVLLIITAITFVNIDTYGQNTVYNDLKHPTGSLKVYSEINNGDWSTPPLSDPDIGSWGTAIGGLNQISKVNNSSINYGTFIGTKNKVIVTSSFFNNVYGIYNKVVNAGRSIGIYTEAATYAIWAKASTLTGFAGYFDGKVHVNGTLSKSAGTFKIDHPQDPENKYLIHSFVESPDMMNVYNGNITTDVSGNATVQLPDYFESLNIDFRYQLTAIGTFAQAIVTKEINKNEFEIATDKPNVKVSWQVTGVRNDPYARQNRIVPVELKNEKEKGKYLNAKEYGRIEEKSVHNLLTPKPTESSNK